MFYDLVLKSLDNINVIYSIRLHHMHLNIASKVNNLHITLILRSQITRGGGTYSLILIAMLINLVINSTSALFKLFIFMEI